MAIKAVQVAIPSDGTNVQIVDADGDPVWGDKLSCRNTGTVTVLLGGPDNNLLYPLKPDEALGMDIAAGDVLSAKVQTAGTAGQITALKSE